MTEATVTLTPASVALFRDLVNDAPNWSGQPLVNISHEERGNLTQLKRAGLVTTSTTRDRINGVIQINSWARITGHGIAYARELGLDTDW